MASVVSTLSPGLAKDYDKKKSYSKGNFVLHRNSYWKCRADIGPETWTEEHWEKIEEPMQTKADLENGKIPYEQIPEMMDDVLEYDTLGDFPDDGTSGKIYVAKDTGKIYRRDDDTSEYVEISRSDVVSVNGKNGEAVLTAGDIGYDDGGSGEDTVKSVLDDTYRKDEVDSLVQSNASHYRGYYATWSDVPSDASLYPEDDEGNRDPGPNDYIAVGDMSGYPAGAGEDPLSGAWRMTYSGSWDDHGKDGWHPAFQYNESPLTPEQQSALNSGITSDKVKKLDALPTASELTPVAPSTELSAQGKPADAKATGDALAGKVSKTGDTMTGPLQTIAITLVNSGKILRMGRFGDELIFENNTEGYAVRVPIKVNGTLAFAAPNPTDGNLAVLDASGNPTDSGVSPSELAKKTEIPPVDDTVTQSSANPVKSSGIWDAIWGALASLPAGSASLYDWCVAQFAKYLPLTGGTLTGELAIGPNTNYSAKFEFDASGAAILLLRDRIGNKLYISGGKLYYQKYDWQAGVELFFPSADGTLALAATNPTAGNLAALDANGNPTDSGTKPSDFAGAADLRYALVTPEIATTYSVPVEWFPITFEVGGTSYTVPLADKDKLDLSRGAGWNLTYTDEFGPSFTMAWFTEDGVLGSFGPDISSLQFNGVAPVVAETALEATPTATLADRTVNLVTATDETSIDIELPAAVTVGAVRYSRDFYLAVTCGSTPPTLNRPSGVTLVNAKGEPPDLSLSAGATTVLRFTEVKEAVTDPASPAVFCVTGGANGGGGSLDLSILAGEFSEQDTYEEGDIVQYQGDLYVCVLDIETPGPWDGADWSDASPVIPVLLGMIRGKADSSDLDSKAESEALAPAWVSGHAYFKGDHVSYNGLLYECLSTVAGSTDPSADTTHWKLTDLTAPDATLDILSDGRLRVVAADGTPMWTQGYALASESAVALSCEKINKYVFSGVSEFRDSTTYQVGNRVTYQGDVYKCTTAVDTAGAWTGGSNWTLDPEEKTFTLPEAPGGVAGDFVLDVENTLAAPATVVLAGNIGTDYDIIVEKGRALADVLSIPAAVDGVGALAELYFTMTAFGTAAKPAWRVVRLNVERQEVGS